MQGAYRYLGRGVSLIAANAHTFSPPQSTPQETLQLIRTRDVVYPSQLSAGAIDFMKSVLVRPLDLDLDLMKSVTVRSLDLDIDLMKSVLVRPLDY